MEKLWGNDKSIDSLFEKYTIGEDPVLDLQIAKYDCIGSIEHVRMLSKINLLTENEADQIVKELEGIVKECESNSFTIREHVEDCHSEIEIRLTEKLGDVGKKVHSGRSRNDQVLTALKLYLKDEIRKIVTSISDLFELLMKKSDETKEVFMPGYTHMQIAMPSTFGLWFASFAESLVDDLYVLEAAMKTVDSNSLGTAAGYGNSFPLDRVATTKGMGFGNIQVNSIYAQSSRGKVERVTAFGLASVCATLSKIAVDVAMMSNENYGFFSIERKFTTGSSIMPHKKNPDGFELVRAYCNQVQALPNELTLMTANLPSGYHRDFQALKTHFLPALQKTKESILLTHSMLATIEVNKELSKLEKYKSIYSVEEVNKLVLEGMPFRDAYLKVAKDIEEDNFKVSDSYKHSHIGSIGNLANSIIMDRFKKVQNTFW